jgi:flagellar hook assembly protein FlgD
VATRLALTTPTPNPFNPRTQVELTLPGDGLAEVAVFDLAGRRVRTLVSAELTAGTHPVVWDGMDQRGNSVASGIYLIRAQSGTETSTQRAVLVR